jgi:hypothetical protein
MASEWIPVTERLPERDVIVLICHTTDGRTEVSPAFNWGYDAVGNWGGFVGLDEYCEKYLGVTHWMPLPDPPGAEPDPLAQYAGCLPSALADELRQGIAEYRQQVQRVENGEQAGTEKVEAVVEVLQREFAAPGYTENVWRTIARRVLQAIGA